LTHRPTTLRRPSDVGSRHFSVSYRADLLLASPKDYSTKLQEKNLMAEKLQSAQKLYDLSQFSKCWASILPMYKNITFRNNKSFLALYHALIKKGKRDNLLAVDETKRIQSAVTLKDLTVDGRIGLSVDKKSAICLWDLEKGKCLRTMKGHTGYIHSVSVTPDGRLGLSGSSDKTLRLWNLENGQCIRTMEGHTSSVTSLSLTPAGGLGLSGSGEESLTVGFEKVYLSKDNTLRLWDLKTAECLSTMEGHTDKVTSVCLTPDGRLGMSGSYDKTVRLWDLATGNCLYVMKGHKYLVTSVSITPDGKLGLSGSRDNNIHLWDLSTGSCLYVMKGHTGWVNSISIALDGRFGLSGSTDNTLGLWDLASGKRLRTIAGHNKAVTFVDLKSDSSHAISVCYDKTIRFWRFIYDLEFEEC